MTVALDAGLVYAAPRLVSRPRRRLCPRKRATSTKCHAFERSSKRRRSFPSETRVKRGHRLVHGHVELCEKLGRNDLCPCGSGRRFQALLSAKWVLWRYTAQRLLLETDDGERVLRSAGGRPQLHRGCSRAEVMRAFSGALGFGLARPGSFDASL